MSLLLLFNGSSPDGTVTISSQGATGAVGTVTARGNANVTITSVGATGAAGSVTAKGSANVTITAQGATASAGTVTASGVAIVNASVAITAQGATAGVGAVTATGSATVAITSVAATGAVGTVTAQSVVTSSKSGVNRLWLIEYYTRELNKVPQNTKQPKVPPQPEVDSYIAEAKLARKVQNQIAQLVNKAEREIEQHMMTMAQEREKELFIAELMKTGLKLARSEDFAAVATSMRRKLREDDELMLFSMVL